MPTWGEFETAAPELADFGQARFASGVAYLATIRKDGAPRVHPVTPIIGGGRLFLFMDPASPKGHDLCRDARYALHCAVEDWNGGSGEFHISGRARLVEDSATRDIATEAAFYRPKQRYILFELGVERAASTVYKDGEPHRERWQA